MKNFFAATNYFCNFDTVNRFNVKEGDYKKAQVAVKAIDTYPKQLVETQDLKKVDAISGASISYGQFVETVTKAVDDAKK